MPANKGNRNRTTHGVYGYLAIGSLPKGASYIRRLLGQFRASLDSAVQEKCGEIGVYSAALIQSACRHEARAQLLTRWLRTAEGELPLAERLSVLREIGKATDSRDSCLQKLGLDRTEAYDPWAAIYAEPIQPSSAEPEAQDNGKASPGREADLSDESQASKPAGRPLESGADHE